MSGHGSLLPIPDDPRLAVLVGDWTIGLYQERFRFPRSAWLHDFEAILSEHYPTSSSRDRSLTARHAAPFWLKDGPNVP